MVLGLRWGSSSSANSPTAGVAGAQSEAAERTCFSMNFSITGILHLLGDGLGHAAHHAILDGAKRAGVPCTILAIEAPYPFRARLRRRRRGACIHTQCVFCLHRLGCTAKSTYATISAYHHRSSTCRCITAHNLDPTDAANWKMCGRVLLL